MMREHGSDEDMHEIKKEIVESRGLVIRTNNLVNSLSADMKSIAKRQASYERRMTWTSATAYVLFAVLSFAGLKLAADARIQETESEKEMLTAQVKELRETLALQTKRSEKRSRATDAAKQFYALIQKEEREAALEKYDTLPMDQLTSVEAAIFRESMEEFRLDLAMESLRDGIDLMRAGRYAEAAAKCRKALAYKDDKQHGPLFRFHLAQALEKLNQHSEALVIGQQLMTSAALRDKQDEVLWLVANAAEGTGDVDRARETLRLLVRKHPRSALVSDAHKMLRDIFQRVVRGGKS